MSLFQPPQLLVPEEFARLPESLRKKTPSEWVDSNRGGVAPDSFFEGPSFDRAGNLYVTDISNGRILKITPGGEWSVVTEYDGWPNGLVVRKDGKMVIACYKRGLLDLDPASGAVTPLRVTHNGQSFKGLNDLTYATNGDLYFTDQGQTGWQDPTGRVYRLTASGKLDLLIDKVPSPNGLVLNLHEDQIYLAVTRANAVWRLPMMKDGTLSKVGTFIQLSGGTGGPDGVALDVEGGIIVCQLGIGVWRFDRLGRPTHVIDCEGLPSTNAAFGGPDNKTLYITESSGGRILTARLPVAGRTLLSHA